MSDLFTIQGQIDAELDRPSVSENAVRKRAARAGFSVSRSRDRTIHFNNAGQFMLCDNSNVVLGDRFDASLSDIADHLRDLAR